MPPTKERKIAVMGYRGVGKSSICLQLTENHFVESYQPTIENTFHQSIKYKGATYELDILDTAGQDEHTPFPFGGSVGMDGYVMVYSVASRPSFELISLLNAKITTACGPLPRILVAAKCDLDKMVSTEEGQRKATELGCPFLECSAKTNVNVEELFLLLVSEIAASSDGRAEEGRCSIV